MDVQQRAKQILDICAYELRNVEICDLAVLESAVAALMNEALREQMREFNKTVVNRARAVEQNHQKLFKAKEKKKK